MPTPVDVLAAVIHQYVCLMDVEVRDGATLHASIHATGPLLPVPDHAAIDRFRAVQALHALHDIHGYTLTRTHDTDGNITPAQPLLTPREHHGPCQPDCILSAPHEPPCQPAPTRSTP